jgi:phage N-6-adenine-methyltransferase
MSKYFFILLSEVFCKETRERNRVEITSMLNSGMFSSRTDEWATPQDLFDRLNKEFHFTLDPCATAENHKCEQWFSEEENGLLQDWTGRVFMNPPYGRGIGEWVKMAYQSVQRNAEVVVCLLPARTDTAWWHDYCMKGEVTFIRGRLKFGSSKRD